MFRLIFVLSFCFLISAEDIFNVTSNFEFDHDEFVPRVVNGWPAKLGDVPYQVGFKMKLRRTHIYMTFCGGTIIGPRKIVSAAHCFEEQQGVCRKICGGPGSSRALSPHYAVAGNLRNRARHSYYDSPENGQWRRLISVAYPSYYRFPDYDIAVLFVEKDFVFNNHVNFIPIAIRNVDYHGQCLVSGYGRTSGTSSSSKLLLAHLDLIPMRTCNKMFRKNMRLFVCTSSKFTDVGKGDSGGPLVCAHTGDPNDSGKGVLVGVVSGHKYYVGSFFTRVSAFSGYIAMSNSSTNSKSMYIFICFVLLYKIFLLF